MLRRFIVALGFLAVVAGGLTLMAPAPPQAADCIICPQIAIECGPCYTLIPQTCKQCAHCKRIPGCH